MAVTVVWLRDDLRIADNPALNAAAERGDVVVCFVLDEMSEGIRPLGGASRWWLHNSLQSLGRALDERGVPLVLRSGRTEDVIKELVEDSGADAVFWNRRYGHAERTVDGALKDELSSLNLQVHSFQANLLFEPWEITTGSGAPYRVYSPFWRACLNRAEPRTPLPAPLVLRGPRMQGEKLDSWNLGPGTPDWSGGLRETWAPGEATAAALLATFLDDGIEGYAHARQLPSVEGTSRLSPHLRFGEVSPFQVWHAAVSNRTRTSSSDVKVFTQELGWREFCAQLLYHRPNLASEHYRPEFDSFPWRHPGKNELDAWRYGRTGFPLIDAGMRQLWHTGWMHNRVRMAAASFLVKNMMVDWRVGEQWFWDTLVDADPASNAANWQWVAGSGADAAPYFRIFNPELQAKKFDPHGEYIRQNVPEWGSDVYPQPIVDLAESRRAALAAYDVVTRAKRSPESPD